MRVFVAGAGGAPLTGLLVRQGHEVTGMTRSERGAAAVRAAGGRSFQCDVYDAPRLRDALAAARPDVVVNQLTSIPPRLHPRRMKIQMAATNRLRAEGTAALLAASRVAGARRFVSQSIAFAYAPRRCDPAAEDDPLYLDGPGALAGIVRAIDISERTVVGQADLEGIVLRYGYFYGPGTAYAPQGTLAADVLRRRGLLLHPCRRCRGGDRAGGDCRQPGPLQRRR